MSLSTKIIQLDKFVQHSDDLSCQAPKLTVNQLTQRRLLFVPCKSDATPAGVQFEAYDTLTSRKAITNERLKFMTTIRLGGNYEGVYLSNGALPENWNLEMMPLEERRAEANRYEDEYTTWILKYDLRSRDSGEKVTLEQLNRDLEAYWNKMAPPENRGDRDAAAVDSITRGVSAMFLDKYHHGPDARQPLTRENLDDDIDSYMSMSSKRVLSPAEPYIDPDDKFADEDFD